MKKQTLALLLSTLIIGNFFGCKDYKCITKKHPKTGLKIIEYEKGNKYLIKRCLSPYCISSVTASSNMSSEEIKLALEKCE